MADPIRIDAPLLRNLAEHLRQSRSVGDSPDLVARVSNVLTEFAPWGVIGPDRLAEASQRLATVLSGLDGTAAPETLGNLRLKFAVLSVLSERLGISSEDLRVAGVHLRRLEASLRPNVPTAVTLAGGVADASNHLRTLQAASTSPTAPSSALSPTDFFSLEAIKARFPLRGFPPVDQLIRIEEKTAADGKRTVVFTATTHKPGEKGEISFLKYLRFVYHTRLLASAATQAVRAGDEESLNRVFLNWGAQTLNEYGIKLEVEGLEKLDPNQAYLFAPTHTSQGEFPPLFLALGGFSTGFVMDKKFLHNPIIGFFTGSSGVRGSPRFVPINRRNKRASHRTMQEVAHMLGRPGNRFSMVAYPQGTRAPRRNGPDGQRVDPDLFARGPLKKGPAHTALDSMAGGNPVKIVPIVINGVGPVIPKGLDVRVLTNQTIRITIGDPIDPSAYASVSRPQAVDAIGGLIEKLYRETYEAPLSTLQGGQVMHPQAVARLLARATSPGKGKPNTERIRVNEYLDKLVLPFLYLDRQDEAALTAWCTKHKMVASYVQALKESLPKAELEGIYSRFQTKEGKLAQILGAPLSLDVYAPEEREALGVHYYLREKLALLLKLFSFVENWKTKPNDHWVLKGVKAGLHGLARLQQKWQARSYRISEPAPQKLIPDDHRLDPLDQDLVERVLTEVVSSPNEAPLPAILNDRIDQAYGLFPNQAAEFKKEAALYLRFISEDTQRFLALYHGMPKPAPETALALEQALTAFQKAYFRGSPIEEHIFAAIRDGAEAKQLLGPTNPEAVKAFNALVAAGTRLQELVKAGAEESLILAARVQVSSDFEAYSEATGLAASSETFDYLPLYGRAIGPSDFKQLISDEELVAVHASLFDTEAGVKKTIQRERDFEEKMRRYLDLDFGRALKLQHDLLRLQAARDALLHNPTGFMWDVSQYALHNLHIPETVEAKKYRLAMLDYLQTKTEKARQKVIEVAWALLFSGQSRPFTVAAHSYLNQHKNDMTGVEEALEANATYWKMRREKEAEARAVNEKLLPDIIRYARWREETLGAFFKREFEFILQQARLMMEAAQRVAIGDPAKAKLIHPLEKMFQEALATLHLPTADGVVGYPEAVFDDQWNTQLANLDALIDPAKGRRLNNRDGHALHYNRAMEALVKASSKAFAAAAEAYALTSGGPAPKLFSFQAAAIREKLVPEYSPRMHREDARNLTRFFADGIMPGLAKALWALRQGLPGNHVEEVVAGWARWMGNEFHDIRVADLRTPVLPGASRLHNGEHTTGWYGDYSIVLALSRLPRTFLLMAKGGLQRMMPGPMASSIQLLARMLPNMGQPAIEAAIIGPLLYGFSDELPDGTYIRPGSQDAALFGAMTMSVVTQPDPANLADPTGFLDEKLSTNRDLRGIGRDRSVQLGATAVYGSVAKVPFVDQSVHYGGAHIGPKPDKYIRIRPGRVEVTARSLDPLSIPQGTELSFPGSDYVRLRQAASHWDWWHRQIGVKESAARRVLSEGDAMLLEEDDTSPAVALARKPAVAASGLRSRFSGSLARFSSSARTAGVLGRVR